MAFLHRQSLRLCPVFFHDTLILQREGPEDVVRWIDAMMAAMEAA
jgi:hypothetical protein